MKRRIRQVLSACVYFLGLGGRVRDFIMWPLASRLLGVYYTEVIALKNGLAFRADMSDIVGRMVLFYGEHVAYPWEPATTRHLESCVKEAQHVIMAGAHIVYAFEPVEYLYQLATHNAALSGLGGIIVEHKALGKEAGVAEIKIDGVRSSLVDDPKLKDKPSERIEVISIDSYVAQKNIPQVDLILLDVEGFEFDALQGCASRVFTQTQPPDLIFEIAPAILRRTGLSQDAIFAFLRPYGYSFFIIDDQYEASTQKDDAVRLIPFDGQVSGGQHKDWLYYNIYATTKTHSANGERA